MYCGGYLPIPQKNLLPPMSDCVIIQVSERKGDVFISRLVWDWAPTFEYVKELTQSCALECCVIINCKIHQNLVSFHV